MKRAADTPGRTTTPAELYAAQVIGDKARAAELFRSLPAHIPAERFQRALVNLLTHKPEMLKYDVRLLHGEVSKAAGLGLLLDPQFGEAYLLPVWNAATKREEPQLRLGYRGLIKLARQSGEVANVYAHEVCEKDFIECDLGIDKRLIHKPDLFSERGGTIGYYAVVKYKDGTDDFEPMTLPQVHAIRDKSDAWCAFKAGKIASTPWATDEDEMGKKTAIKRLLKRAPQSPDLASALRMDDEPASEASNVIQMRPAQSRPKPRSIAARLDSFASAVAEEDCARSGPAERSLMQADQLASVPSKPAAADEAAYAPLPAKLLKAMDRGRAARRGDKSFKLPKGLNAQSRAKEADAFLRGWREESFEIRAEEFGSV